MQTQVSNGSKEKSRWNWIVGITDSRQVESFFNSSFACRLISSRSRCALGLKKGYNKLDRSLVKIKEMPISHHNYKNYRYSQKKFRICSWKLQGVPNNLEVRKIKIFG